MNPQKRAILERKRSLLELEPTKRVQAILASPRPAELVRSLAAQELFLTLQEAGLECATPLLRYASRHQIDFLVDIDAWTHEGFDPLRFSAWIERFRKADAELVTRWLLEADEANVVLALSRLLHVYKLDESVDEAYWPPERTTPSLDGVYFLEGREGIPAGALKAVWDGLGLLRERRQTAYEALLEQVLWIVPAEQEEQAFGERSTRLAERGFPELDEALEVWAATPEVDPIARARLAERVQALKITNAAAMECGALAETGAATLTTLRHALADLPRDAAEQVLHDIVRLGNRFAVASLEHLGEHQTHADGLATAFAHINLGLELLSEGRAPSFAAAALASLSVFELNRVAVGALLERALRARNIQNGSLTTIPNGLARLDPPLRQTLQGLLAPRPHYLDEDGQRPWRTRADLLLADQHLDAADALGVFLTETLDAARGLPELTPLPAGYRTLEEIEWSAVASTALARRVLGEAGRPHPLDPTSARRVLDRRDAFTAAAKELALGPALPYLNTRLDAAVAELPPEALPHPQLVRAWLFR